MATVCTNYKDAAMHMRWGIKDRVVHLRGGEFCITSDCQLLRKITIYSDSTTTNNKRNNTPIIDTRDYSFKQCFDEGIITATGYYLAYMMFGKNASERVSAICKCDM
jgi:hypothetical protein